ncbi:hypothetical protein ACLBYD_18550 [Rhodococcus sp. C26F]|uniref:hypothetical protein n=1 Tax=Rhodococcus pyridinivorans TaxID=103816 RepID=UPI0020C5F5D9|nr:hypothetical protein [Rhodococcus pyridinivorans]UTM40204.1 hypothetical protein MX572_25195 [Rhodococcus pyridinivorans]
MNHTTPNGFGYGDHESPPPTGHELRERLEQIRQRQQGLTVAGSEFGIFYDQDNPFDADLQMTFDDGTAVNQVVIGLAETDLLNLEAQINEVLTAQRKATGHHPVVRMPASSTDWAHFDTAAAESGSDSDGDDDDDDDGQIADRNRFDRVSDPMNLRGLVNNLPPIRGIDSSTWAPLVLLMLVVIAGAAFLGSMF